MEFTPLVPLTRFGRVTRSVLLVALILGSLFPALGDTGITLIAAGVAAPVILYELLRWLPRFHPAPFFVAPIFLALWAHMVFVPPALEYGEGKMSMWMTGTLVTALAASLLRDEGSVYTFAYAWITGTSLLALVALTGFQGGRADAFDANPIWLGRAIATGILMMIWLAMRGKVKLWLVALLLVLLGAGLIATGSRGPIIAIAVGAVALAIFSQGHRVRKIVAIVAGAVVAYQAVVVLPFFVESRLVTLIAGGENDTTRQLFWTVTPPVIAQNPGGVGVGNWSLYVDVPGAFVYPHNLFLEVFTEYGVVLGVGLIVVVLAVLVGLLRRTKHTPIAVLVFALLAAEITQVSVSGDLNARTFWFLLTLGFLVATRSVIPAQAAAQTGGVSRTRLTALPPSSRSR